jgi:hypothetical protein
LREGSECRCRPKVDETLARRQFDEPSNQGRESFAGSDQLVNDCDVPRHAVPDPAWKPRKIFKLEKVDTFHLKNGRMRVEHRHDILLLRWPHRSVDGQNNLCFQHQRYSSF